MISILAQFPILISSIRSFSNNISLSKKNILLERNLNKIELSSEIESKIQVGT